MGPNGFVIEVVRYSGKTCTWILVKKLDPKNKKLSRRQKEKLTRKQWYNLSVTFSPTASKVARRGTKNPYPTPPKRLPTMPKTGQRTRGTGNETSTTAFRTGPSFLVLKL